MNPEYNFPDFVTSIIEECHCNIVIVDDGSNDVSNHIFDQVARLPQVILLRHYVNLGKGRALKTAFNYCLGLGEICGVVTADADGQHLVSDIIRVVSALRDNPDKLVLGCRDFIKETPWKSKIGNVLTRNFFYFVSGGIRLRDTQTGLRGIPVAFMKQLMNVYGERFEFETEMLLSAIDNNYQYLTVPISTVYCNGNRATHFNPVKDSLRIYSILFRRIVSQFVKFIFSSLSSAVIDILLFSLLFYVICPICGIPRLFWSVLVARVVSSFYNFFINKTFVFNSKMNKNVFFHLGGYYILCAIILICSYYAVRWLIPKLPDVEIVYIKAVVDLILFVISFIVQRLVIFSKRERY